MITLIWWPQRWKNSSLIVNRHCVAGDVYKHLCQSLNQKKCRSFFVKYLPNCSYFFTVLQCSVYLQSQRPHQSKTTERIHTAGQMHGSEKRIFKYTARYCTELHSLVLHCSALHLTAQYAITLHCLVLHYTSPYYTALHYK